MAAICTTDIWNTEPNILRPKPLSREEEVSVDMPMTEQDDEFLTEHEDVRSTHICLQRMIESALNVFHETTMVRRMEAMVEAKVVSFSENANLEASKGKKTPVYQDV